MTAWAGDPDPAALKLAVDRTAAAARSASQDLTKKRAAAKTAGQAYITAAEKSAIARAQIAANEPLLNSSDKEVVAKATLAVSEAYLVREAETAAKETWQRAEAEVKRAANVVTATMAAEAAARSAWKKIGAKADVNGTVNPAVPREKDTKAKSAVTPHKKR